MKNIRKKIISFVLASLVSGSAGFGIGLMPAKVIPSGTNVVVPEIAIEHSPALDYIDIIHFKKDFAKPTWAVKGSKGQACYGFISKGAKLIAIEDIYVNDANSGISSTDVLSGAATSGNAWDSQTSTAIFGNYALDPTANFDQGASPDGRNELSFGNYAQAGVIAVARIWGVFYGPPQNRYIDQFDILFDTDYVWGNAQANPSLMDFQNIATHELGHGVGLADVYESGCLDVTMYGYSDYGETKKRTLEPPDIKGLRELYEI